MLAKRKSWWEAWRAARRRKRDAAFFAALVLSGGQIWLNVTPSLPAAYLTKRVGNFAASDDSVLALSHADMIAVAVDAGSGASPEDTYATWRAMVQEALSASRRVKSSSLEWLGLELAFDFSGVDPADPQSELLVKKVGERR